MSATPGPSTESIFERYGIDHLKTFGEGGYGRTFAATDRKTGEQLVVKVIDSRKMKMKMIVKECEFMERAQGNEHIIRIVAHTQGMGKHSHLYFIFMERASGGELFDQLTNHGGAVPEAVARSYMQQYVAGIAHCHVVGIAHRDIKLENALLNDQQRVKVIDFGLAHQYPVDPKTGVVDRSQPAFGMCGSKSYAAPEVLLGENAGYDGFQADVWSLGVSLFGLLNGFFPVDEAKKEDWRFQKLVQAQQQGKSSVQTILGWYKKQPYYSAAACNLLDLMLMVDPDKRPTVKEVLAHPFITGKEHAPAVDVNFDQDHLHYRGAGGFPGAEAIFTDDMEIIDDGPVYRSMGGFDLGVEDDDDAPEMPGLMRQAAFGGAESGLGDDLFTGF